MSESSGWIGVDLDGTLAHYGGWKGPEHIGAPIPAMVDRVKAWLAAGKEVRIFTARVWGLHGPDMVRHVDAAKAYHHVAVWVKEHVGQALEITCTKDFGMLELWDDRAVRIVCNTGEPCCGVRSDYAAEATRQFRSQFWRNDVKPIINAIGEISVQEAMDAIERNFEV